MATKQAIEQVMTGKRKPMTVAEIAEAAIPLSDLKGATPKQVIYSVLYSENKKPNGLVVRVDAGTFSSGPSGKRRRDRPRRPRGRELRGGRAGRRG